jgi:hypothetical protein
MTENKVRRPQHLAKAIPRTGKIVLLVAALLAGTTQAPTPAWSFAAGTYVIAQNGSRPALSATGRYVAFISPDQLTPGDTNPRTDAYVRDLQTGVITLVSQGTAGAVEVDISDDGSRVAFLSVAVTNPQEAWVRDLPTGALLNATRGPSNQPPDSGLTNLGISGDGKAVTFNTQATSLVAGTGPGHDVFVKRLDTGALYVASRSALGVFSNGLFATNPSISYDGWRVAFVSTATNLSPDDTDTGQDVYLKDLETGAMQVAQLTDRHANDTTMNADGTQVVFGTSFPATGSGAGLFHHDFPTNTTKLVSTAPCTGGGRAKLDGSGDLVAFVCSGSPAALLKNHATGAVIVNSPGSVAGVAVSADGEAFAWDDVGVQTRPLRVLRLSNTDDTAPNIGYALSPTQPDGLAGWYRSDVSLAWSVTDPDSTVVMAGCVDQQVTTDQAATDYVCTASSDGGTSGPVVVTVKRDATAPDASAVITPTSPDGGAGWYITRPSVTFECQDALSGIASCPSSVVVAEGVSMISGNARDVAGNHSEVTAGSIRVDITDPTVTCEAQPTFLLHAQNASLTASVTDDGSGPSSATVSSIVNTGVAGPGSLTLSGQDVAGRSSSAACGYTVSYAFVGFSTPVDNNTVNVGKAGKTVPLKWRLLDSAGAPVTTLASAHVSVAGHACDLGATEDQLEEVASGGSGLRNLGDGYYQFNWSTPTSYALSCKTLRLDLDDGQRYEAEFRFTK